MGLMKKIGVFFGMEDEDDIIEYGFDSPELDHEELKRGKVISIHSGKQMRIAIHEPKNYEDAPAIIDDVKLKKAAIINFEGLDQGLKKQIFDFINGGLYAVEGKIQKINKDIFLMAPNSIEIEGLKEELKKSGVFQW